MSLITIFLFFIYTYGIGHTISFFLKGQDNFFERHIMRIGFGLSVLPFLIVVFNLLHMPIDWKIFLAVSLAYPAYSLVKSIKSIKMPLLGLTKSNLYLILVFAMFSFTLFMYVKGAFIYPYFEDDDPWAHAVGVKYVAIEKNVNDPLNSLPFIKPYPPGYDALLGILHQTSPSLMWTMKFFNALIASLGIVFFYFFAKNFMQSSGKALAAAFILTMVPSYLSHFIWAHSMAMTLFIVSLYCLVMMDKDRKWAYLVILAIAGVGLTQPTKSIKFFFMFIIFFIVKSVYERKFMAKELSAVIGGYLLSLIWWATNWKELILQKKVLPAAGVVGSSGNFIVRYWELIKKAFPPGRGTATRAYTFNDFFTAKSQNLINNPIGVGVVLSLLTMLSLVLLLLAYKSMAKDKKVWAVTSILWLIYTFLAINVVTFNLPVGLFAFRFWAVFSIPLSIVAAEGFIFLAGLLKQIGVPGIITTILIIALIFLTSGQQKYAVNTSMWGPGQMWTSNEEIMGYLWLKNLPIDAKVFSYSSDEPVIGFDKFSCAWCKDIIDFRKDLPNKDLPSLYSFLKRNEYGYLVIDGMAQRDLAESIGQNKSSELFSKLFSDISESGKFNLAYQTKGAVILEIV